MEKSLFPMCEFSENPTFCRLRGDGESKLRDREGQMKVGKLTNWAGGGNRDGKITEIQLAELPVYFA